MDQDVLFFPLIFPYQYDTIDSSDQKGGIHVNQGIIAAILSILFYLTNLLSGAQGQPIHPIDPPMTQQSYVVLGQTGTVTADRVTVRHSPASDGKPLGTVTRNTTITILDQVENWYKIRPRIGIEGWIPEYAVSIERVERKEVEHTFLGFYPGGKQAYESLLENGTKLTSMAPLGWKLDSYGRLIADFDPEEMGRSLYFAGNQEMDTYAHVHVGSSPSRLLSTSYLQANSLSQLQDTLEEWGLKGVLVDIDYVPGEEQPQLFEFLGQLATRLRQKGLKTMVALPWDATIEYKAAARAVDYIVLESARASTDQQSGPLTSIAEMEAMLQEITHLVHPDKIILAVSTGGLHWSRTGIPSALSHQEVLELAAREGASVKWDTNSKAPYFQYGAGREVWFENRYSVKYKLDLIKEYNLGGLALRDLGQEDSDIWTLF